MERKPMLQTVAAEYLDEIKAGRKKKTYQAYDVALRYFIEAVGNKSLEKIKRTDLLDFRVYLRDVKAQEPRSEWNKFSNVMGFLKRHGIKSAELGITAHDWPQYTEEEPEIYEQEELDRFFTACNEVERLIYEFFLMTGFREQEVIFATDRSVSFTNSTVSVRHNPNHGWTPKMYKERTLPVPPSLITKLYARGTTNGLLFATANGQPQYHFLEMAKHIAHRAGLPKDTVWLHKFRATFASRCLWGGVDLRTVQAWMGHTDLASTMRYLKPQRGAAVREKVEAIWG
jgi:integrase